MLAPVLALALVAHPRIAVMPLGAGVGISPPDAAAMTEALVSEVRRGGAEVITQAEITSVLSLEQQRRMLGCSSDACVAELGGALGVRRLVTGNVSRLGASLLVHLRVLDAVKVRVVSQSDRRLKGGSYDDLLDALPVMVSELFPEAAEAEAPARPAPPEPAPAAVVRGGEFRPPDGMFAIHVRASRDLGLVAWLDEASASNPKLTVRRYVSGGAQYLNPSGSTEFGLYWLVPAAEFPGGWARFGFVVPSAMYPGDTVDRKLGKGCCGAMSWSVAEWPQVWIDPRNCDGYPTAEAALRAMQ